MVKQTAVQQSAALSPDIIQSVVLEGDLSKLDAQQRVAYYNHLCQRLGLDPATQPLQILKVQGKQVIYCNSGGAQQLGRLHDVSHEKMSTETKSDVFVVYMRASTPNGRHTESAGAVGVGNLRGEALANAIMKAETVAKRRATLDLIGLGMFDETVGAALPDVCAESVPPESKETPQKIDTPGDYILQFGREVKGKKLSTLTEEQIKEGIVWAEKNNQYPRFVQVAKEYLRETLGAELGKTIEERLEAAQTVEELHEVANEVAQLANEKKLSEDRVHWLVCRIDEREKDLKEKEAAS